MPEAFTELLLEQMLEAVVVTDPGGVIRLWNAGAERLFGFTREEMVGGSLDRIIPERLRDAHAGGFRRAVESGHLKAQGKVLTTRATPRDGRRLYVDFSFGMLQGPAGEVIGVFAVGRDATERFMQGKQQVAQRGGPAILPP